MKSSALTALLATRTNLVKDRNEARQLVMSGRISLGCDGQSEVCLDMDSLHLDEEATSKLLLDGIP